MPSGVVVTPRTAAPTRGARGVTDTLFLASLATTGPTNVATLVHNLAELEAVYGVRTGLTTALWDYLDAAFQEGLKRAYVGRYSGVTYMNGLNLFTPDLGSGQVAVIGVAPSAQVYADLQAHCMYASGPAMNNRVALRDVAQGQTVAQMEALADSAPVNDEYGATFAPWVQIPPPAGVYGGVGRVVPASAAVAGAIARVDGDGNPNRAAAGDDYALQYVNGFDVDFLDADQAGLQAHGINALRTMHGVLEINDFRTNIAVDPDQPFWQFSASRGRMYLRARAAVRGQAYMFKPLDGQGKLAGALGGDLAEEFKALYDVDGLYGLSPQEAYAIEVGEVINTVGEAAVGNLHAVASAKFSPFTNAVLIDLVTVPVTGTV